MCTNQSNSAQSDCNCVVKFSSPVDTEWNNLMSSNCFYRVLGAMLTRTKRTEQLRAHSVGFNNNSNLNVNNE